MPLLPRYFGFVREISFLSRMKFQFAFDMFVFRNKKFDRSFALVSSIDPENSWFSFFLHVEKRIRKLFDGSLYRLNFRLDLC